MSFWKRFFSMPLSWLALVCFVIGVWELIGMLRR